MDHGQQNRVKIDSGSLITTQHFGSFWDFLSGKEGRSGDLSLPACRFTSDYLSSIISPHHPNSYHCNQW